MNKILPILSFLLLTTVGLIAQNYDYESAENSVTFTYFGSSLEPGDAEVIDNPNATGINTSTKVVSYTKAANSETWAGAYANPMLPVPFDLTLGGQICIDVHFDHIGNLAFKLEKSTNGAADWIKTVANTKTGEWETLCYDLSAVSDEDPFAPAAGGIYDGGVVFFDFGMNSPDDVTTYFDNIRYIPLENCVTIFDFETPETTTEYKYFGSSLEPGSAQVITNPNPTGANESDNVIEYVKAAGAETWAGAYADPAPAPIDASTGGQLCVDVHMDHIGNIGLKLEASSTGGSNWIQTVENTVVDQWEQLCIDLSLNGLEDAMTPAAGHIFGQLVIFPDFGTAGADVDVTTYVDNLKLIPNLITEKYNVTFNVDMNNYTGAFTTVFLSGGFNTWSPDANPMSDDDGDGVWSTTVEILGGSQEYKFQVDGWNDSDQFLVSDECVATTVDDQGNVFSNRVMAVTEDTELDAVCFNSCYACGDEAKITWNLNMSEETVSDLGVYVAGGATFGHGDLPAMTDEDGDGVYTLTIRRQKGFESDYTFLNGLCLPNWECKEEIAGLPCAVEPFSDRHLDPVTDDEFVINTCFGECTTTTECLGGPVKYNATFQVDMNASTVGAAGVFLAGEIINGWAGDTPMTDDDGDGVYTVTIELFPADIEYKYINGDMWEDLMLDSCTMADPSGQFINRFFVMEAKDTILPPYLFESCLLTVDLDYVEFNENLFTIRPNLTSDFTVLSCDVQSDKLVQIMDLNGQVISEYKMSSNQSNLTLDMTNHSAGLYIVSVTTDTYRSTKRLVLR